MELAELISGLDLRVVGDPAGVRVCDVTEDSRTAVPGSLFIARGGLKADGRRYAAAAVECGAVAVLSDTDDLELPRHARAVVLVTPEVPRLGAIVGERFWGRPSEKLALVGVTGTNGKTSVSTMVRAVLQAARAGGQRVRCGLIGGVVVDDGREIAPAMMTTPPAVELSRTLATMVDAGCGAAAMEVSSHALDQRRADALAFDVAVFTNLTGDHLDYHKTMEAYLAAKRRLFELLPPDGVRVLNADDGHSKAMAGPNTRWCSVEGHADASWRATVGGATLDGMELSVDCPLGSFTGHVAAVGGHNAINALQALCAGDAAMERLGLGDAERLEALRRGLGAIRPPRGRLERVSGADDAVTVFVDFAHTDDALRRALDAVRGVLPAGGTLTGVFGCGGDKDRTKRPRMGRVASERCDRVVVTSDNPRTERPSAIVDEILAGIPAGDRGKVSVQVDRGKAIRHAITTARDGEVIVIAGKGHETEQISCDAAGNLVSRHFDDAEEARAALRERRLRGGPSEPKAAAGTA